MSYVKQNKKRDQTHDNAQYELEILFKVIPQKLELPMNFFETFPEWCLPSTVSKNTIKMIGHHAGLRDVTGQSYPIYACTRANHVRYSSVQVIFCGS